MTDLFQLPELKVFKSLNCSICSSPFAATPSDPKSPRKLRCGQVICRQCFNREQPLQDNQDQHPNHLGENCFLDVPAYFIINLISPSSFAISPNKNGYILKKKFPIPDCPVCLEQYSWVNQNRPVDLDCNHVLCYGCFDKQKIQVAMEAAGSGDDGVPVPNNSQYEIRCPTCRLVTIGEFKEIKNQFISFLEEYPQMTEQLDVIMKLNTRQCASCNQKENVDEMLHCTSCDLKICSVCSIQAHRTHSLVELLAVEAQHISNKARASVPGLVATYKSLLPELNEKLRAKVEDFERKLLAKIDGLNTKKLNHEVLFGESLCKKIAAHFEQLSEDFIPQLRLFETRLDELLSKFEDLPP